MASGDYLKQFVNNRLAAAAEEIYAVFHTVIVGYEEELERRRTLLDVVLKPVVKLHRTELPQKLVLTKEMIGNDQPTMNQDRNTEDQGKHRLPQTEKQQKDLSSIEVGLRKEPEEFTLCSAKGENIKREDSIVDWNPEVSEAKSELAGCEFSSPGTTSPSIRTPSARKPHFFQNYSMSISEPKLKKETEELQLCSDADKVTSRENPTVSWNPGELLQESEDTFPVTSCVVSETNSDLSLCPGDYQSQEMTKNNGTVAQHKTGNTATRTYECLQCGKSFSRSSILMTHIKIHSGERPYACLTCAKTFVRKDHLREHQATHRGDRPFVCATCSKTFLRKSHLKEHMIIHTGERPHVCKVCNMSFVLKKHLTHHIVIHTGEKSYVCPECNKSFVLMKYLKRHLRIHKSEKPYVCPACGKRFVEKVQLRRHQLIHKRK